MEAARKGIPCAAVITGIILYCMACAPPGDTTRAVVVWSVGDVAVTRGAAEPRPVVMKEALEQGDRLRTGKGSFAVVQIGDAKVIRIQAESTLDLTKISTPEQTEVFLGKGQVLSKVEKLRKGESYGVRMPTALAAVRGTEFSATYREGERRVSVKSGRVDVTMKAPEGAAPEKKIVSKGTTLVLEKALPERPITGAEALEIEFVAIVPALKEPAHADTKVLKKKNDELLEKQRELEKSAGDSGPPRSLRDILKRYQRVDEIVLYNGRVIRGVILRRGARFEILTPGGTVMVPKNQVRNTRLVQSQ
ncbi:MAG TPA: FecR family protein [Spirochaetota bacterium]|nr:FecR family protein [Spirochaetota bacterium]